MVVTDADSILCSVTVAPSDANWLREGYLKSYATAWVVIAWLDLKATSLDFPERLHSLDLSSASGQCVLPKIRNALLHNHAESETYTRSSLVYLGSSVSISI